MPSDETGLYTAWCRFLQAIERRHPRVLASLVTVSLLPTTVRDVDGAGRTAVREWLVHWHLSHDIAYLAAIGTVRAWVKHPGPRRPLRWVYPALAAWHIPQATGEPILPDPFVEDVDQFLVRARTLWRERVHELRALGYRETRVRPALAEHCDWLADFQVGGVSKAQIARTQGRRASIDAVKRGLASLADLLQLTLRTHRSGRPATRKLVTSVRS
jgi:hypothetical protein